jgi:signal transduction histidine kinase
LAALRLRLENLERDVGDDGRDDLAAALAEVGRLSRLVDGLLALARADAARPAPALVDVSGVVAARVEAWAPQLAGKGVLVDARQPTSLYAFVTPGSLEQVLDNLLSNALPVSRSGDTVTIEGLMRGSIVELHVRDEGPGMTADERSRAFDRFWRAGSPGAGTGLGLAIVHRLVTADHGGVELREVAGGGLDVVVTLPAEP